MSLECGEDDYTQLKAYRSISLLSCMGKIVEEVVTELVLEENNRRGQPSDGQFGCRNGWTAIDAAIIMVERTDAASKYRHIRGVLLTDIDAARPSVRKGRVVNLVRTSNMNRDLIRWTERFHIYHTVYMINDRNTMQ